MSTPQHTLKVKVIKKDGYWVGLNLNAPGGVEGDTLAELRAEIDAVKHFCLDLPPERDIAVDYVYEIPGVAAEELAAYRETRAQLVRHLSEIGLSQEDSAALLDAPGLPAEPLQRSA